MKWFRLVLVLVLLPFMVVTWTLGALVVMIAAMWEFIAQGRIDAARRFWTEGAR